MQPQPQTVCIMSPSPVVHRVPREVSASVEKNFQSGEESVDFGIFQPGLATQQLFQQMLEPVIDLQVMDEDDVDTHDDYTGDDSGAREAELKEEEQRDFYASALSALPSAASHGDVEAELVLPDVEAELVLPGKPNLSNLSCQARQVRPGQQDTEAASCPFNLGLGQIQSAYTVERFVHADGDDTSDDDTSSESSSDDDAASVVSSTRGVQELDLASTASSECAAPTHGSALPQQLLGPRIVPVSPWRKSCRPPQKSGPIPDFPNSGNRSAPPLEQEMHEVQNSDPTQETPGENLEQDLERELAYIKVSPLYFVHCWCSSARIFKLVVLCCALFCCMKHTKDVFVVFAIAQLMS